MALQLPPLVLRSEKGSALTMEEMDQNWIRIRDFVNGLANLISVSLTPNGTLKPGALNNVNQIDDGLITPDKLAPSANGWPVGSIRASFDPSESYSTTTDEGWLKADGTAVSRTTFARLFAKFGTTFGSGDGVTTFTLPNLQRRVLMGSGGTGNSIIGPNVGDTGGASQVTLTADHIPAHTHTIQHTRAQADGNVATPGGGLLAQAAGTDVTYTSSSVGGGQPHNNIQPSIICHFFIKT